MSHTNAGSFTFLTYSIPTLDEKSEKFRGPKEDIVAGSSIPRPRSFRLRTFQHSET